MADRPVWGRAGLFAAWLFVAPAGLPPDRPFVADWPVGCWVGLSSAWPVGVLAGPSAAWPFVVDRSFVGVNRSFVGVDRSFVGVDRPFVTGRSFVADRPWARGAGRLLPDGLPQPADQHADEQQIPEARESDGHRHQAREFPAPT
ncbi:hypothetical protein [Streptomyces sp. NPDC053542]|uniref:hypothetical protein n=1 Tax=Streptomyces sp. NPDC053542 TaxID=3365710 RepID=UPI0037D698FF